MDQIFSSRYRILIYIAFSVLIRFSSFFPAVLDHDESTYLIIGRDILNGKNLYTDVTDTKPPGIFLFYAGLEFLFGSSIFLKRLIFALIVAITAWLVSKVSVKFFSDNKTAFAGGVIYIIYTSIWTYHGRSPNTELLFNLTTIASLLLFTNQKFMSFIVGGLLMGLGFIVKYMVLFDFMAFMLFLFATEFTFQLKKDNLRVFARYFFTGIAFLIPFALTNLWFWMGDHFEAFKYITYDLPGNYGNNPSLKRYLTMLLDLTAKFLPVSVLVFYVLFKKEKPISKENRWFFAVWMAFIFYAMYIPGREFSHYTIQLMLPLSLLAGVFFHPEFKRGRVISTLYSKKTGVIIFAVLMLVIQTISYKNEVFKTDYDRQVSRFLKEKLKPGESVYVSNYRQIIYYLLKIDCPTPYVHSNLLFTSTHKAFKIVAEDEIKRIINTKPRFVIVQNKNEIVENLINENYTFIQDFKKNSIRVFERIE